MRALSIVFFLLISNLLYSTDKVDSLLNSAKSQIDKKNWEQAQVFVEQAHDFSAKEDYAFGIIRSQLYKGWIEQNNGDITKAISQYLDIIFLTEQASDSASLQIRSYASVNIGNIFKNHDLFDLAIDNYHIGLNAAKTIRNLSQQLTILSNLQRLHRESGNYSKSIETNQLILAKVEGTRNNLRHKLTALNGLGIAHQLQKKFDVAEFYYEKLRNESLRQNNIKFQAYALHNLGDISYDQGLFPRAIELYQAAIDLKKSSNRASTKDMHDSHRDIAKAYIMIGNFKKAQIHASLAEQFLNGISNCIECEIKVYDVLESVMINTGNQELVNHYSSLSLDAKNRFETDQLRIKYESKLPELRLIVENYYADLDAQRDAQSANSLLWSVIIAFGTLILLLTLYHLYSRYRVRRFLGTQLEKLNWED